MATPINHAAAAGRLDQLEDVASELIAEVFAE